MAYYHFRNSQVHKVFYHHQYSGCDYPKSGTGKLYTATNIPLAVYRYLHEHLYQQVLQAGLAEKLTKHEKLPFTYRFLELRL